MSYLSFSTTLRELKSMRDDGASVFAVHYACESIYKQPSEPPAISAIALAAVFSSAAKIYSVMDRENNGERYVLESFYTFLRDNQDARLVHWNMNSADFGFQAIANRYVRVCGNEPPCKHADGQLIDLDELIGLGHGRDFADHPKLINITKLNDFRTQYFLSGKEESELFEKKDYARIRRSVGEKAAILGYLARRLVDGTLETRNGGQRLDFAGSSIDSVAVTVAIGARMLDVQRQLKTRHAGRPTITVTDEYDAQDLFNALLRVFFDDIRREDWSPAYAGGASRIDFVLPRFKLAIELKYSRQSMTSKDLGEQLIVDIAKYGIHPSVRHLVCLIFDPDGHLNNPRGIESDLSKPQQGLAVTVRIFER
jgi:hypothetical protein